MVKLKNGEIKWIVKHAENGDITTRQAAEIYGVSIRRVQQLVKEYREKNIIHKQKKNRRPKTYLAEEQKKIIDEVWKEMKVGTRLLYYEIRRRGHKIPHNKIHTYLKETGRTIPNPKKQKKRKRCRYERKHSCSIIHGDWHRKSIEHPYAIIWLDDIRHILAGGEFKEATIENSITFEKAMNKAREYNVEIKEVNTDKGSQFYLKCIPSHRNNPQTNGKFERLWY